VVQLHLQPLVKPPQTNFKKRIFEDEKMKRCVDMEKSFDDSF